MAGPRTIRRFGRTYAEFDPDGIGGGPPTWVLSSSGGGSGTGSSASPSGTFTPAPATPGGALPVCDAGAPLYYTAPGRLDLALAADAPAGAAVGTPAPYLVAGLAADDARDGQMVGVVSDGQVSRTDWTPVLGVPDLVPGARYYLSEITAGKLTAQCPSTAGATVVCVGQALSERALEVEINLIARL